MSGGRKDCCDCGPKSGNLLVTARNHHHSAFNGHRRTYSRYSEVWCKLHNRIWRTTARYADLLPDARPGYCCGFPEDFNVHLLP